MTDNVVTLHNDSAKTAMELALQMVDRVKRGDVTGFAVVALHEEQQVGTCWSGECEDDVWRILGGIEDLKLRYCRECME